MINSHNVRKTVRGYASGSSAASNYIGPGGGRDTF